MIDDRNAYFCWETCRKNVDRVSFAGGIIKTIAKSAKHTNLFDAHRVSDLVPDEALRKFRMAEELFRRGREKKVSITVPGPADTDEHKEITRRQTGFVRPEDLTRLRQFERPDDDDDDLTDDELDDYLPYTRQVSIQPPSVTSQKHKMGFGRLDRKDKRKIMDDKFGEEIEKRHTSEESDSSETVPTVGPEQQSTMARQKKEDSYHGAVGWKSGSDFRATRISDSEGGKRVSDFDDGKQRRMSVLTRLMDDVATDQEPGPTLKDYKPLSEKQQKNSLFLLTYSPEKYLHLTTQGDDPRERYLRRRLKSLPIQMGRAQDQRKSIDHILGLQHGKGKGVYRKISTDYVKTIDQIENKEQSSIRSLEYAKHRPAISVKEYRKQNREYNESLERKSKLSREKQGKDFRRTVGGPL